MREITARAWYEKSQSWVYFTFGQGFTDDGLKVYREVCLSGTRWYQYTGLKDKNGKEIYEGDILKISDDHLEEVKWVGDGDWYGDKQPMVGFVSHGTIYKGKPIEVIGNIYENKDLLV